MWSGRGRSRGRLAVTGLRLRAGGRWRCWSCGTAASHAGGPDPGPAGRLAEVVTGPVCRVTGASVRAGRLLHRADLGAGELGVDEEPERVGLLVLLHEAVQRGAAQAGQPGAARVAQPPGLADLRGRHL